MATDDEDTDVKTKAVAIKQPSLPARHDSAVDRILQETARSNPLLRFKEGKYLIRDDEIEMGREYIAYPMDWTRGWVKWEDGVIVDPRMIRVADESAENRQPTRADLGDQDKMLWTDSEKDPWQPQNILPFEDVETGQYVIFTTGSIGGKVGVEELCNSVCRAYKAGKASGLPVIALATKPFTTKFGTRQRPFFRIARYHDLPPIRSDLDDEIPF